MTDPIPDETERLSIESESLPKLFARVVADAKDVASAEIEAIRATMFRRMVKARGAVFLGVATALLLQAAVITALVGLLGILSLYVGLIWATVITVVGALIVAGIMGRLALNRIAKIVNPDKGLPS
jgi:hypothetical protein